MPLKLGLLKTRHVIGFIAYLVSAVCLFWVFRGINFREFAHEFRILEPRYLCIAIAFSTAVYFVNSLRWMVLLRPLAKVGFWRTVQAVYIGLLCNEVLPLRPGELVRCYLLSRWTTLPLPNMFASAAVERVLEGLCLMAAFFAVAIPIRLPRSLLTGATIVAVCIVVLAVVWIAHAAHRPARKDSALQGSGGPARRFLDALALMGNKQVAIQAMVVSFLALACFILSVWFLMKGDRFNLSVAQAAAVFLIIRVGTIIPSAPGNIGSFQFFCVLGMGLFGIEKSSAAAFSVLIYSAFTLPLLIGGIIAVAASGISFRTLVASAEA